MLPSTCGTLSASQLDFLTLRGFFILPPIIEPPQIDVLCRALSAQPEVRNTRGLYARRDVLSIPLVRDICDDILAPIARQVLGEATRPVRGLLFDKLPDANWKVPWHQDLTIAVRDRHEAEGFGPLVAERRCAARSAARAST